MNNNVDVQKLGQENMDRAMRLLGDWNKGWQTIAVELSDYSKRSLEQGTKTFEKLLAARSVEQAIEIQTSYARRAYDEYMQQMTRLGGMYANIAREAYKPLERRD